MPPDEQTDDAIKKRIQQIFPSPEVANKVIDLATSTRPLGWSRRSNAPYYKREYATQIKADIDSMIASGNDITYPYEAWCGKEGVSQKTLYIRINQSIGFLIDKMDTPEHKYGLWYEKVHVNTKGSGLKISYVTDAEKKPLTSVLSVPRGKLEPWRREMEDWLESDEVTPFVQERLALTSEEVTKLKSELSSLHSIMATVTATRIAIIRMNE